MSIITLEYTDIFNNNDKKELKFSKELLQCSYNEGSLFVSYVNGKSMEPLIQDTSLVVSDLSNKTLVNDGIYLVYKEDAMWIKKAVVSSDENTAPIFVSINPKYAHLVYKQKEVRVIAKTLLTFTNL